ncbi:conjugative transposon protein TraJ [Algoriphagus aestuarii]|nr:conjugative transposon protein TraJ [Algoriphagus aestuarii]
MNKKKSLIGLLSLGLVMGLTPAVYAQEISGSVENLHQVLSGLYDEMIPLADQLISVARALAGFAAIWYIGFRVWGHIARAEPIDFYPLLRPFAIGLAILMFPQLLSVLNGAMQPLVEATSGMVEGSDLAIAKHIEELEKGVVEPYVGQIDEQVGQQFPQDAEELNVFQRISNEIFAFNLTAIFNKMVSTLLQVLFFSAALCINTIRTFQLIVLSILGPIVLGLSVFDGFHHTLPAWFARYINVSLWLPIANIFGAIISKIQLNMMVLDGDFSSSLGYLVFMVIAILGYLTVPNVAGFIVQPGGRDGLLNKATNIAGAGITKVAKSI